jgi:peptide/nickel transport system substrate-binding protein
MLNRSRRPARATAVLSSVLATVLLASCTSAVGERRDAADGTPVDGGTVRIGALTDLRPKNLYAAATTAEQVVSGLVFDTLTSYATDDGSGAGSLTPQPALAESWEVSDDGLTVTLHLRNGVLFHDGSPFTSADVAASLANYADPTHSGQLARTAALVGDVDTDDPATAVLHLTRRVNNLFDLFDIVPVIDDKEVDAFNAGTGFNGTGAFRFGTRHPGAGLELPANDAYWGGAPRLDAAELVVVPDERTLYSQLRSGQLDVVSDAGARDAEALENNGLFRVLDRTGVDGNIYAGLNTLHPGLTDVRVRRAIGSAIDRDRILEEVFRGRGRTTSLPWPTYSPAYDEAANEHYIRDPGLARQLLTDAGGAESIPEIPVSYTAGSASEQNIAQIIAANLGEIGLRTRLDPQENAVMIDRLRGGTFDGIWVLGHSFAQYTPSTLPVSAFPFNSEKNASNFLDEDYATDATDAWTVADPDSREASGIYRRLNNDLLEDAFVLELVAPDSPLVTTSALHGVNWSKRSEPDLAHAYLTE